MAKRKASYPAPVQAHTRVRRAVTQGARNISKPEVSGSLGRFGRSVPQISGFNSGSVPKNY